MRSADAARRWAEVWTRGWQALDPDPVVALYAVDAVLSIETFRTPHRGRDEIRAYVTRVFAQEEDPSVWMGSPIVDGARAAVPWWASLREDGVDTTLAGTSVLTLEADGLVREQWDTWNVVRELRSPPTDWSPFATGGTA